MTMAKRPGKAYILQSRGLLKNTFDCISDAAIEFFFNNRSNLNFSEAYRQLSLIDVNEENIIEGAPNLVVRRRYPRRKVKISIVDDDLIEEISMIPDLAQKPASKPNEVIVLSDSEDDEGEEEEGIPPAETDELIEGDTKPPAAAVPNEVIELLGSDTEAEDEKAELFECKVCYGDYESSDMYNCGFGNEHAVCKTCICRFVSEQLHGNGSIKFKCISDVECECEYSLALLEKLLPEDLNRQVTERTFHEFTDIEGMWQCPSGCGHLGFVDQDFPWVGCPNCHKHYCTKCNELMHNDKTCDEARMERVQMKDPKHRAHEAMSQACKRFCPHCNQEFMKSDGCNKIKCSKCKLKSCYLCADKIEDYSHFCRCRSNACNCGKKCPLWTSTDAMEKIDKKKRIAAGRKVLAEAGITDEKEIRTILGSPEKIDNKKPAARPQGRAQDHPFPNFVPRGFNYGNALPNVQPLQVPAAAGLHFPNDAPRQQNVDPPVNAAAPPRLNRAFPPFNFGGAPANDQPAAAAVFRFPNDAPRQQNVNPPANAAPAPHPNRAFPFNVRGAPANDEPAAAGGFRFPNDAPRQQNVNPPANAAPAPPRPNRAFLPFNFGGAPANDQPAAAGGFRFPNGVPHQQNANPPVNAAAPPRANRAFPPFNFGRAPANVQPAQVPAAAVFRFPNDAPRFVQNAIDPPYAAARRQGQNL